MNSIGKYLAQGLKTNLETKIKLIKKDQDKWYLEEQIYRCKSLGLQEEQARRLKQIQTQQNQLIWNDFNRKYVNNPQSYTNIIILNQALNFKARLRKPI